MTLFASAGAHNQFLAAYLLKVFGYTAAMVVVLYITAGLVKLKQPNLTPPAAPIKSPVITFWKLVWQRFTTPPKPLSPSPDHTNAPPPTALSASQSVVLGENLTAHVLDLADGRWLLVSSPTGTQLHALQGAQHLHHGGSSYASHGFNATHLPLTRTPVEVPDGLGPVSTQVKC